MPSLSEINSPDCALYYEGQLLKDFNCFIGEAFRQRVGDRIYSKLWDQALANRQISWKKGEVLTPEKLHLIEEALEETFVYSGKGISYTGAGPDPEVSAIVRYLLNQGTFSKSWMNAKNAKGILLKSDPELLKNMREEFRIILDCCAAQIPEVGSSQERLFEAFVGNLVALIPYTYPEKGEPFNIPMKVDGAWKTISYTVDKKIALTPKFFSSPLYAYGFTSPEGPPLLSFTGTTYPAGDGFFATLLADFSPGFSVGDVPYRLGRKKLDAWLDGKKNLHLYGMSLGGALTFQVLRRHQDKIARVDAYSPPGLYPWNWKEDLKGSTEVNIYMQENDLVSAMGAFPRGKNAHIYRVFSPEKQNPLAAHARVYTGGEQVTLLKSEPFCENGRFLRKLLTALHILASFLITLIPLFCLYLLYFFLGRPLIAIFGR